MSAPVAALVLAGLFGVPLALLWAGQRFRTFPAATLGAYRGAIVGYGVSSLAVAAVLIAPPYTWPPTSPGLRVLLASGLLAGPLLGALAGRLLAGPRR